MMCCMSPDLQVNLTHTAARMEVVGDLGTGLAEVIQCSSGVGAYWWSYSLPPATPYTLQGKVQAVLPRLSQFVVMLHYWWTDSWLSG